MPTKPHKHALAFVFVTVLLDVVGFGIIIPVTPELIMELTGEGLGAAAVYGGWLLFLYAMMQFFFAPVIGNLSDRFGRRPVLLTSLLAFGLDYVFMAFAPTLGWLFAGRCLAGIAGASATTAHAFIADVSAPEDRSKNFGLVGAAFGLGFVLGPVLGGILGDYGPRVPFLAAAGLALVNLTYGFVVLPESLSTEKRRPFSLRRANPIGTLLQVRRYPVVLGILGTVVLYQIAHDANPSTWSYYTMLKFGWDERQVGYSLGFIGLLIAIVQGGLIRSVLPRLGERRSAFFGLVMMAVGFLGFALAPSGRAMYAFMVPFSLCGFAMPALRGIMSKQVPAESQGELQGAITSVMSLTAIVAPLLMTRLFGFFTGSEAPIYFPGAPFLAAAVMAVVCIPWFARVAPPES